MKNLFKRIAALTLVLSCIAPTNVQAADNTVIDIVKDNVKLGLGETVVVELSYGENSYGDIAVMGADDDIAVAVLEDAGNGKARMAIAGVGTGATAIAVYKVSNPTVVDYIGVQCDMAEKNQVKLEVEGDSYSAIYDDKIVSYKSILQGKNDAQLAVGGVIMEHTAALDCLKVSGVVIQTDTLMYGMNTFYADCYDAMGGLMKSLPVFVMTTEDNEFVEMKWYIPEGCANVILR